MKRCFLYLMIFAGFLSFVTGCKVQSQAYYDYKSKVIGTELDGTYTIRAWGRARNRADAYVQARKQAVYDVIFNDIQITNGISPSSTGMLRPLLQELNAKQKYEAYFNAFFADGGEFEKYCSLKERRTNTTRYTKTDAQTLAQVTVCVDRARLKEKLKQDNILK